MRLGDDRGCACLLVVTWWTFCSDALTAGRLRIRLCLSRVGVKPHARRHPWPPLSAWARASHAVDRQRNEWPNQNRALVFAGNSYADKANHRDATPEPILLTVLRFYSSQPGEKYDTCATSCQQKKGHTLFDLRKRWTIQLSISNISIELRREGNRCDFHMRQPNRRFLLPPRKQANSMDGMTIKYCNGIDCHDQYCWLRQQDDYWSLFNLQCGFTSFTAPQTRFDISELPHQPLLLYL